MSDDDETYEIVITESFSSGSPKVRIRFRVSDPEPATLGHAFGNAVFYAIGPRTDRHSAYLQTYRHGDLVDARPIIFTGDPDIWSVFELGEPAPQPQPAMVEGVGPDAPECVNERGGRQSASPFRCDLLPAWASLEVARVLKHGADKYGVDNWRRLDVPEHLNHLLVHVFAWLAGDRSDDHLAHAACRSLMALDVAGKGVRS